MHSTRLTFPVLVALALFATACGGGSSPSADPGIDAPDQGPAVGDTAETGQEATSEDGTGRSDPGEETGEPEAGLDVAPDGLPDGAEVPTDGLSTCPGPEGCACNDNADCYSGFCTATMNGKVCSAACQTSAACAAGWTCTAVTGQGGDLAYACVDPAALLCRPCNADADCAYPFGRGQSLCLSAGASGSFCGVECSASEPCPDGYACQAAAGHAGVQQCVPANGAACPCTAEYQKQGYLTACYVQDTFGSCPGQRTCATACNAKTPAAEVCNGLDDDCNGLTDGLDAAAIQGGYFVHDQPLCEKQAGVCAGSKKPASLCLSGMWQPCTDAVYAAYSADYQAGHETTCDGKDNDCNGLTDDGFTVKGLDQTSYSGVGQACGTGACAGGTTACTADGTGIRCDSETAASPEVCNGLDDDCDGLTDAADVPDLVSGYLVHDQPLCEKQAGVCAGSRKPAALCVAGVWQACDDAVYAAFSPNYQAGPETTCDGMDSNCDGQTDEGVSQACYTGPAGTIGVGACHGGTQACAGIGWGPCTGQVTPSPEVCNGIDDDCNGLTDADDTGAIDGSGRFVADHPPCERVAGVCAGATKPAALCVAGAWAACDDSVYAAFSADYQPSPETKCDGLDNDCNGQTDETFPLTLLTGAQVTGAGKACGTGRCAGGTTICTADQTGILCSTESLAVDEACNGVDDDCNGVVDDPKDVSWCTDAHPTYTKYYFDGDGDGDPDVTVTPECRCGPAGKYTAVDISHPDCCDTDSLANHNQGGWFGTPDACGSWDYNCNGTADIKDATHGGGCTGWPGCVATLAWVAATPPACGVTAAYVTGGCGAQILFTCNADTTAQVQQLCH